MAVFTPLPDRYDFPSEEVQVARFWKESAIFQKSLEARAGAPTFVFYEGPPTANGMPHPGHVLTRVIKDIFPRYKTMRGFRVPRKAGWDTHGLPVEVEVEKSLQIKGKEGILEYGVEDFIKRCIESVFVYTKEWEELTERIGFWVDLSDAYVTFHQSYVESVWWSLKKLFEKNLLYQDRKVVWMWAQGGTTLSSAEVNEGYRETDDPSVFIRFKDRDDAHLSYLAWTTTPWTLPSNIALAVAPEGQYVEVTIAQEGGGEERVVVAEALVESVFRRTKKGKPTGDDIEPVRVSEPFSGRELIGRRYEQVLPFKQPEGRAFEILGADFVVIDAGQGKGSGTGIVHIAPAFGEDDYRVAREHDLGFLQLVDEQGRMTEETGEVAGLFCKDADRPLIRKLREQGSLLREEVYRHDYPFCPRAKDDPLIQYARPAWFVRTSQFRDAMLANNAQIQWVPEHIRDGRFGKFLEGNVDWALSRERFWGTPLPVWKCEETGHMEALGSYEELLAKPDVEGTELWERARAEDPGLSEHLKVHKPYIDAVSYASPKDPTSRMRRVPEVIDCWYDSGAMPFAQWGFPHVEGSREQFESAFPADFISEAIDQTRGWFYSLLAEATLLWDEETGPRPYRSCIVLGHVCDAAGNKMSKRHRNYVSPNEAMDAHGADALRWYFLFQGHPWTNARFSLDRVGEVKKDFLIRLQNVFSFFTIYANIDGFDPTAGLAGATAVDAEVLAGAETYSPVGDRGLMDRWILSELHLTAERVCGALDAYDILGGARALFDLVDELSNWYVRRSRSRFWGSGLTPDKLDAYWTLYECLVTISRLTAPFIPFFSERLYRTLVVEPFEKAGGAQPASVHLTLFPEAREDLIDRELSRRMAIVTELVALGRSSRAEAKLRVRQPLREAIVVLADPDEAGSIADLLPLVEEELNVKTVRFSENADEYVEYELRPNYKLIGPKLGPLVQKLKSVLAKADAAALRASLEERGVCEVEVEGQTIELGPEEIEVRLSPKEGYAARATHGRVLILDTGVDDELRGEWWAREIVAAGNSLRGEKGLAYEARIRLSVACGAELRGVLERHQEHIGAETLAREVLFVEFDGLEDAKPGSAGDQEFAIALEVL